VVIGGDKGRLEVTLGFNYSFYELRKEAKIAMVQLEQHFDISDKTWSESKSCVMLLHLLKWLLSTFARRMLTFCWQKK